jgi:hypothetical protein
VLTLDELAVGELNGSELFAHGLLYEADNHRLVSARAWGSNDDSVFCAVFVGGGLCSLPRGRGLCIRLQIF